MLYITIIRFQLNVLEKKTRLTGGNFICYDKSIRSHRASIPLFDRYTYGKIDISADLVHNRLLNLI